VADKVAILDKGTIVCLEETEHRRESVKRLILSEEAWSKVRPLPRVLDVRQSGDRVAAVVRAADEALAHLKGQGITPQVVDLNLDEIFEAYVIGKQEAGHVAEPVLERVA
jgi:ABC-2 type transport system ATP-binding protein